MTDIVRASGKSSWLEDSSQLAAFAPVASFNFNFTVSSSDSGPIAAPGVDVTVHPHVIVRLVATQPVWLALNSGYDPTADDDGVYLPAGVVEYFRIEAGSEIGAVRAGSEDGRLSVTVLG